MPVRFLKVEITPAPSDGRPPQVGDGYRFHRGFLWRGAERLGTIASARVEGDDMVVTLAPAKLWHAFDSERPYLTMVVRAADEERAVAIATAAAREYGEIGEVTVELIDPTDPEGVVVEDAS